MEENNRKEKEEKNDSNKVCKEDEKMTDGEEKIQSYVTSLEYATDTATSNELEPKTSDSKGRTFSIIEAWKKTINY